VATYYISGHLDILDPPPLSPNTIEKSFFGSLDAINRDFLSPRPGRTCFLGSTPKAQLT